MAVTKEVTADTSLVAFCGLYCGACGQFLKGKCPGCSKNEKAAWCKIRVCCMEKKDSSCADCKEYREPMDCKKFNNFFSKLFVFVFKSDRAACLEQIRKLGINGHAERMATLKQVTVKRGK